MGGALEKLLEKARKEPEKYRGLLLEEKRSLEADLRHRFSWMIALAQLEIAYFSLSKAVGIDPLIGIIVIMVLLIGALILSILCTRVERMIKGIREVLYGDPMGRWDIVFATAYVIACGIIAIILLLFG